ncbi:MAG: TonB-dependent receptor [Ignavibacteria bacterium]
MIVLTIFSADAELFAQKSSDTADSSIYKTEEIKVISNKLISNELHAYSKIQFINEAQIKNSNGDRLSDVLSSSNGVFIKSYGGNSSLSTISISGSGSEHTLILLNGVKLNSSQNNLVDLSTITKDNIKSIEVLNSGSGTVYGSEAMAGVVNIITKQNFSDKIGITLNGQSGSYGLLKFFAGVTKNFSGVETGFNYSNESSENDFDYFYFNGVNNELKFRQHSAYEFSNYDLNLNFMNIENSELRFYSNYSNNNRDIPGIETGSDPSDAEQSDKNWNSIFSFNTKLSSDLNLKTIFNFQNNLSNYNDNILTDSYYKNLVYTGSIQADLKRKNYKLTGGYEYSYYTLISNEVDADADRDINSVYLLSEIEVNEMFRIYPSVRADNYSDPGTTVFTGQFGLNVKPFFGEDLYFKANAGNNYSAPTFNELYWKDLGNRDLNPERSFNAGGGVIYKFDLYSENKIELTYNYINFNDKIVWTPQSNGNWVPENRSESVSNIFLADMNLHKDIGNFITADMNLNYSFTNAENINTINPDFNNKQLIYVPLNLFNASITLNYKNSGVNVFYNFTDKRYTDPYNDKYLPAFITVDGNVFYILDIYGVNSTIRMEVNNIFNENYQVVSGYPMPLRNLKFSVNLEY